MSALDDAVYFDYQIVTLTARSSFNDYGDGRKRYRRKTTWERGPEQADAVRGRFALGLCNINLSKEITRNYFCRTARS